MKGPPGSRHMDFSGPSTISAVCAGPLHSGVTMAGTAPGQRGPSEEWIPVQAVRTAGILDKTTRGPRAGRVGRRFWSGHVFHRPPSKASPATVWLPPGPHTLRAFLVLHSLLVGLPSPGQPVSMEALPGEEAQTDPPEGT